MKKIILVISVLVICIGIFAACTKAANSNAATNNAQQGTQAQTQAQTDAARQESTSSGTNSTISMATTQEKITVEQAKEIALKHAGATEDEIKFFKSTLEFDDGKTEYEIEFYFNNVEYNYDIDAFTGEIISYEIGD